jgi:hypothetical protein
MPSLDHDALVLLFQNQPELAARLLRDLLHVPLPAYTEVRLAASDLTEVVPAELRADAVILCVHAKPVLGVIIEAQLSRDERKRFTWPAYVTILRARYECPVELLVLAPDRVVAKWAATPIQLDLGATFVQPRVLGPDGIPIVTDAAAAAKQPELAVLSVCAHGKGNVDTAASIALAAASALDGVSEDLRMIYLHIIRNALSVAARKAFEMLPDTTKFLTDWTRPAYEKGLAEGELRGKQEAILDILEGRGLGISASDRERVVRETDVDVVRLWLRRALVVATAADLFD